MKSLKIFFTCLPFMLILFLTCQGIIMPPLSYLVINDKLSKEDQAAVTFLEKMYPDKFVVTKVSELSSDQIAGKIVWAHIPDSVAYLEWLAEVENLKVLKSFYDQGGKLLFTNFGALLPKLLGIEPVEPEIKSLEIEDNWLFDKKGLQSFRGHPVFHELFGGTFIWDGYEDHHISAVGYFGDQFPQQGKVVAVGKSYITIHGQYKLMMEYQKNQGRMLSIGAFVNFSKRNRVEANLHKFLNNCFHYLAGDLETDPKTYWNDYDNQPKSFAIQTSMLRPKPGDRGIRLHSQPDMVLQRQQPKNHYFNVSGTRALVMGKENGGIDELWIHPFRVLRDYQAGIIQGDSILWLRDVPVRIEVRPESFSRFYQLPEGQLTEILIPSLPEGGALVHYRSNMTNSLDLVIKFRSDLRWMWPYDEKAIGDVWYGYDDKLSALHLKDSAGDLYAIIGADVRPVEHLTGQFEDITWQDDGFKGQPSELNQVYHAYNYRLSDENSHNLNVAVAGTNTGMRDAIQTYHSLLFDPQLVYTGAAEFYRSLLENVVIIDSPDEVFNRLWKWTIVGTERFFANTPGVGQGLLAGYSTTARGWGGRHKISGRPGYAWYFGRDSEWSGFAIDDYGNHDMVRKQIIFLQKYQDISGKIFHEISTSGVVHFDAADATPLYIILAAHYLRSSGDLNFIKESWLYLKRAMDFLYSTDTDGDLLIENTNVGHGWVEGGKLWGAHTTFYLAAIWAQTLTDAAYMAGLLNFSDLEKKYNKDAHEVIKILNNQFWNASTQFFNYGKLIDGSYNQERTVLPAVAMYYGLLDDDKVDHMLDEFAGNNFSTAWGVRIVSSESQLFVPYGYHYGSVWPLFTGWTALAEYQYGNSVQAFSHMMNNLLIKNYWSLGFVEEVMNGAVYKPSGVCPHQCWSETNILHPGMNGMVGWKPVASENRALLTPRFPLNWHHAVVKNLKVGKSVLNLSMERSINSTNFLLSLKKGPPVQISLAPEIPKGMVINQLQLNGKILNIATEVKRGLLKNAITFNLVDDAEINISHQNGIGMVPYVSQPLPGDTSIGHKIIRESLEGSTFTAILEGKSNSSATFEIMLFDQKIISINGGKIESFLPSLGTAKIRVNFLRSEKGFNRQILTLEIGRGV